MSHLTPSPRFQTEPPGRSTTRLRCEITLWPCAFPFWTTGHPRSCQRAAKRHAIRIQWSRRGVRCSPQGPAGYHHDNYFVSFQTPNVRSDTRREIESARPDQTGLVSRDRAREATTPTRRWGRRPHRGN